MLITEVDGSIGVKIGAQLGYDFSFVREAKALGLTGDVGLKLETGLEVAISFSASGRYLLAMDRESLEPRDSDVRLRLFKLSNRGWDFGLNLCTEEQGVSEALPEGVDDLTRAVFGVHGLQVLKDLKLLEGWTDPKADLPNEVLGLTRATALDLLGKSTGIDPKVDFDKARGKLLSALKQWDELPATVSSVLWQAMEGAASRAEESLIGRPLGTVSAPGLDALLENSEQLRPMAADVLPIVIGGVIKDLHALIADRLDLEKIRKAVTKADFNAVDDWLKNRLSTFFDSNLGFERLDEIKSAINAVIAKRQEIYAKARQALTKQYDFSVSAKYQKTTEKTALVDATFDVSSPAARDLLALVLGNRGLDALMTTEVEGVTVHRGVLTHEVQQSARVQIHFPFYHFAEETLNRTLAKVRAAEDGGRVLFYELDSKDLVAVKNRSKSQLTLAATIPFQLSGVRVHSLSLARWTYEYKTVKKDMRREELDYLLGPIVATYLPKHFGGTQSPLSAWTTDLGDRVAEQARSGVSEFGDVLLSLELSQPAATIAAWFAQRDATDLRRVRMVVSRQLQASLRRLLYFYYFQDLGHVRQNLPGSALLVYAALPASTNIRMKDGAVQLNQDLTNSKETCVYWDWRDLAKRQAMVQHPATRRQLTKFLAEQKLRLEAAGRAQDASFFCPDELNDFVSSAQINKLVGPFDGLLQLEATIVEGTSNALERIQEFHKSSSTAPVKAIEALADFGVEVTKTFNHRLASVYGDDVLRPLGSMVFLEAARALDPALATTRPSAMLSLTVLKEQRTFEMSDFLKNRVPDAKDIALAERCVEA
jgi:hypothetical protein